MIVFGPYRMLEKEKTLLFQDQPVKIEKIPFDILLLLIQSRDRIVSREEITNAVWGQDRFVEAADGISTAVRKIRRALNDNADAPLYIQTVVGRGYRFICEDVTISPTVADPSPSPSTNPGHQTPARPPKTMLYRIALAAACLVITGFFVARLRLPDRPGAPANIVRLTSDNGFTGWPSLSSDGKLLAFASNRAEPDNYDIYLRPVAEGSQSKRLTSAPGNDTAPAISPVGDQIAFESQREPAGIYVMPLLGGEARLIAKGGSTPRYSPDGAWIAYHALDHSARGLPAANNRIVNWRTWIVSADGGGQPYPLRPELFAGNPVWAGNDFLILTGSNPSAGKTDWWVTPRDGSWVKPLGVYDALRKGVTGISAEWSMWTPSYFRDCAAVFSARTRDGANLWRIRFSKEQKAAADAATGSIPCANSPEEWTPVFPPERVTTMSDHVRNPSIAASGLIATEVVNRNNDVYELPFDSNNATPKGPPIRLTQDKTSEQFASVSADGELVAYTAWRGESSDLFLIDRKTGQERQLTATAREAESHARLSPDGSSVIYRWGDGAGKQQIRRMNLASNEVDTLCEKCEFHDQTADGKSFIYGDSGGNFIRVKDFAQNGAPPAEPLRTSPGDRIYNASLDPTNRWIAFVAVSKGDNEHRIYAAPFRRDGALTKQHWIEVATGMTPIWSPNGRWLYFDEGHDGFRCLWARPFDPVRGKPSGEKTSVAHIHGVQHLIVWLQLKDRGVARNKIVFSVNEETSNIWLIRQAIPGG